MLEQRKRVGATEQGAATRDISHNIQLVAQGTNGVASNIAGVNEAAAETGTAATQVLTAADDLSRQADRLRTDVNGEVKQDSRTSLMIHDVGAIVEWISGVMTLLPGDLILTGTPAGVGPIVDGDTVSITISDIGTLSNPVVKKQDS